MLTLRKTKAGFGLDLTEDAEAPPPNPGQVTVRVEHAGICGSDVHAYEWTDGYGFMVPHLPVVMGHEFAGRIAATGAGVALPAGTPVTVMPFVPCGTCANCTSGATRNCLRREAIGLTRHGGFAGFVTVPAANCLTLPDGVDTELGALTEPLGVGCEAVLTGEVGLGDTVLVMGPGTIGQAIALFARAAGAGRVLVAGRADGPRFDVMRQLGFTDLLDVAEAPLNDLVLAATGGRKVDVVLEATGHPPTIVDGLSVLRTGGVLVIAGIHPGPVSLPLTDFVRARHQLRGTHGCDRRNWDKVLTLLGRDPEAFRPMITHRMPLARGLEGFELARQRAASKVMLTP
ncbi:MAG TPA: alcohol dehydrogenase catalytic domain-containing protein [Rhodopila sp.]|nr:alcohol dehydrogenase catalytic domain-containing protein [Rhodopila sp.]